MTPTPRFPRLMTISGVYQPVADFIDEGPRAPTDEPLGPLDCYLLHLAIEFHPREVAAFDLACESTRGAATLVCLSNSRVRRVSSRSSAWRIAAGKRLDERIAEFAAAAALPGASSFSTLSHDEATCWKTLAANRGSRAMPLVVLPASAFAAPGEAVLGPLLDAVPEAVVLVVGAGRIGDDPAARRLVGAVQESTTLKCWFLREHAPSLAGSGMVLIAEETNQTARDVVRRISAAFTTNYDFLTLVRDSCLLALENGVRGEIDPRRVGPKLLDADPPADDPSSPIVASKLHREVARESIRRLKSEVRRLEQRVRQEEDRPLAQSFVRRSARKIVHFGRRHRNIFAPRGSAREKVARSLLQMGRSAIKAN